MCVSYVPSCTRHQRALGAQVRSYVNIRHETSRGQLLRRLEEGSRQVFLLANALGATLRLAVQTRKSKISARLLGVNGAGKTTTMRMITGLKGSCMRFKPMFSIADSLSVGGDTEVTKGDILVGGVSVQARQLSLSCSAHCAAGAACFVPGSGLDQSRSVCALRLLVHSVLSNRRGLQHLWSNLTCRVASQNITCTAAPTTLHCVWVSPDKHVPRKCRQPSSQPDFCPRDRDWPSASHSNH